ncbi:response regulator transcription factor [Micrococcales bacterium 31B]|nr:response regulator transcription factor [Micrococcales bacterium 31B]
MKGRILVVDDDAPLAEMIEIVLQGEGYETSQCGDGNQALGDFRAEHPDLVLLDLMLPGKDGIEVCRSIRSESSVPIIMLTAKSDTIDIVHGLESGADDYMAKPFKPKELIARIRARMRRPDESLQANQRFKVRDITIDVARHEVMRGEQRLNLTPLEFDLLLCLVRRDGQVYSREQLLAEVWGYRHPGADTRLVNVHIQRLRAKIERDPDLPEIVLTVRGVGYRIGGSPEQY